MAHSVAYRSSLSTVFQDNYSRGPDCLQVYRERGNNNGFSCDRHRSNLLYSPDYDHRLVLRGHEKIEKEKQKD